MSGDARDRIRLVCFDLGGVIIRICRTWIDGCNRAGIPVRGEAASERMKEVRREITRDYTIGAISEREWARRITDALDGLYSFEEILRIHQAWLIDEYPGWGSLIETIHDCGFQTACLSNTNDGHWMRMVGLNSVDDEGRPTEPEFASVPLLGSHYASHLIGYAKPDPAIYREFEKQTGIGSSEILFFDDLVENIRAASNAGWTSFQIDHEMSTVPQVRQALELLGLLESDIQPADV